MYKIVGDKGDGLGREGGGWGVVRHWKSRGIWRELFQIETRGMGKRSLVSALTERTLIKRDYEIEGKVLDLTLNSHQRWERRACSHAQSTLGWGSANCTDER